MYKENRSLNEWFHEGYGGEPEIQVPEKRNKQIEVCSWRKESLPCVKAAPAGAFRSATARRAALSAKMRWLPGGQTEGLMRLNNSHTRFVEISASNNPPVKNQRFLPAPFTQGGLTQLANRTCTLMRYTRIRGLCPLNDTHRLHRWVCFMGDWAFAALRRDQGTRGPNWLWSPKLGSPSQAAMVWGI